MKSEFSAVVLVSGRGSNLKSLLERASHYKVICVISDNPDAGGLQIAADYGVQPISFKREDFSSRKDLKNAIFEKIYQISADAVCLAGFMQIVDQPHVEALAGKLINIHPSLLPAYPGLHTHERAIQAGEQQSGCTVHFVDSGVDTGPLIAQCSCPLLSLDSPETLAARVLSYEHILYPWVLNSIAAGDISLVNQQTRYSERALAEAAKNQIRVFTAG